MEKKKLNAERKIILESFQEKKEKSSQFFFQTGRGRFNISITFNSTAEVIPVRGGGA